jgi:hypothetical protein
MCADSSLDAWLAELAGARFVLVDERTEELLVRTFVKWDGGYKHAQRVKAVIATALAIRSLSLRSTAVDELGKLGLSTDTRVPQESYGEATRQAMESHPSATREPDQSGRVVVTEVSTDHNPQPVNHKREPSDADDPSSPFCQAHQPNGPAGMPCTGCADRAKALKHAKARAVLVAAEAKTADAARRRDCGRCNQEGYVEGPDGGLLGKCSHSDADLRVVS